MEDNVPAGVGIAKADFDANTILAADTDDTPAALVLAANTLLGRGVSGNINDLDVDAQSFVNLLENGDFESWSGGVAVAPDGWVIVGAGASVARSATHKLSTYSAAVTRSGADSYLRFTSPDSDRYKSRVVTFGAWVKCASANTATLVITDSITYDESDFHTGGDTWEWITVTRTISGSATWFQARLYTKTDTTVYFDGAILVEGSVCPAFSPKPLVDDGRTVQIDSTTNKVTLGNLLACTPSSDTSITAAGGITVTNTIMRVYGTGGVDITANPQIAAGSDGQLLIVQGTSDANTVQLDDGTGLILEGAVAFVLGANDMIMFAYDSGESAWIEINRSNN